jgi:hypothetical protein
MWWHPYWSVSFGSVGGLEVCRSGVLYSRFVAQSHLAKLVRAFSDLPWIWELYFLYMSQFVSVSWHFTNSVRNLAGKELMSILYSELPFGLLA